MSIISQKVYNTVKVYPKGYERPLPLPILPIPQPQADSPDKHEGDRDRLHEFSDVQKRIRRDARGQPGGEITEGDQNEDVPQEQ